MAEIIVEPMPPGSNSNDKVTFLDHLNNPMYKLHRYLVLIVLCFINIGNYYIYDNPGALQSQITRDMGVTTTQYTSLYAMYSWPNVILGLFGGYLIDKVVGVRIGTIIFLFLICLGQSIMAFGAFINKFWIMQLGRFVFGLGGENLTVAANTYAVSWYKGSELNMVFGILLSISRLGSTLNFKTMKQIYDYISLSVTGYKCLGITLLVANSVCIFSLISGLLMAYFDKRAEKILKRTPPSSGEVVKFSDVFHFGLDFWLVSFICVLYYITIFPFVALGVMFFVRKFHLIESDADTINSSIYLFSAFAAPLLGILIDKVGRTLSFVFVGCLLTLVGHGLLAFTFINPWAGVLLLGFGYSVIACALWPMIPDIVPDFRLGTAYGVVQCVQNLGFALASLASGAIVDSRGYISLEIFFLSSLILCILCIIMLFFSNLSKKDGMLNISAKRRKYLVEEKKAEESRNQLQEEIFDSEAHSESPEDLCTSREDRIRKRRNTDLANRQPSVQEAPSD